MTKAEYKIALQDPRWKAKRAFIVKRDKNTCQKCGRTKYLQVHHIHYIFGNQPWEVPDNFLITLCSTCHKKEHEGKEISKFILHKKKAIKKKNNLVNINPKKKSKKKKKNKDRKKPKLHLDQNKRTSDEIKTKIINHKQIKKELNIK